MKMLMSYLSHLKRIFTQMPPYLWFIFGIFIFFGIKTLIPKKTCFFSFFFLFVVFSFPLLTIVYPFSRYYDIIDLLYYSIAGILGATIGIVLQISMQLIPNKLYTINNSFLVFLGSFWMICFFNTIPIYHPSLHLSFFIGQVFIHLYFYARNIKLHN
ncbi:hypothetical protein COB28_02090 [Candidatus Dependentiae bacterium]|nr:MAG: hypothetical protein COB28_02090 [Candidatus Dependentiae bacterium]